MKWINKFKNMLEAKFRKGVLFIYFVVFGCVALLAVSIPVMARVSFLSEHMQILSEDDIKIFVDMTNQQNIEADILSRPFADEERSRMEFVREEYEKGCFPKGDILIVSGDEVPDVDFYYNSDIGKFFLPQSRNLTDEELRQYIEFYYRRDYSLQTQRKSEDLEVKKPKSDGLDSDIGIPKTHIETIQNWLMVLYEYDYDPSNLEMQEVLNNDEDMYQYVYLGADKSFHFTIQNNQMTYLKVVEDRLSQSNNHNTPSNRSEALNGTENYKYMKETLEILGGNNNLIGSAWYLCKTDSNGNSLDDSYAYMYKESNGENGWIANFNYGSIYPYMIRKTNPSAYLQSIEQGKPIAAKKGIVDEVIPLDVKTGVSLLDNSSI